MDNKVESPKKSTSQQPSSLRPEDNLPPEQPTKISWFRWFVQKIIDRAKWIKDLITFKRDTKIITRRIDKNYLEPIEKKELRNIEFEQMVKQGTFSNEVWYVVKGDVALENIKSLPQHIKIFGDCEIKNSPKLKKLSSNFIITGDVNFDSCSSLKMNADDSQGLFYIQGELVANKCNSFNFINSEKKVSGIQGAITINSCDSFSYLPAGINNDVNIINCKSFKKLLAGNYHNLNIKDCKNFSKIHPNTVTENLILNNNKTFTSFPDNLTVKNLSIISCPIKSFVSKITILQDLLLESCEVLKEIHSSNIQLEGDIIINSCQQLITNILTLNSWPEWICSPKPDGSLRSMQILGHYKELYAPTRVNLISPNIKNRINKTDMSTIDAIWFSNDFLIEVFSYMGNCRNQITYPYISEDLPEKDKNNLIKFLKKIRRTEDCLSGDQEMLGKQIVRIWTLFQKETDPNITEMAMKILEVYNSSTDYDEIILALDDLIMLVEQKEAQESGDDTKIIAAIKHNMMIGISDAIVREHTGNKTKNILKASLKVRELFNLPIGIRSTYCDDSNFNFSLEEYLILVAIANDNKITADFIAHGSINRSQIEKYLSYYKLPVVYTDTQPECTINEDFYDEMVKYKGRYYSYDAFLEWYNKSGTDPYSREPIDMAKLYRVDYKTVTTDVEDNYIVATETKELTTAEFEELLASGEFSNNVHYVVNGDVNINHYSYQYLPQHVTILGDFTLKNALELKHLPYNFKVTGSATLENCISFTMRNYKEEVLDIQKQLTLINCPTFTELPTQISFDVNIIECNNFKEVLSGNYKNFIIERCANFSKIHPNTVIENLMLIDNEKFISFPDDLTVKNLSVISCPIEEFTSKITVLENVLFEACHSLHNIQSSNIKVNGNITIEDCNILKVYSEIEHFAKLAGCEDEITFPYISEDLPKRDKNNLLAFLKKIKDTEDYQYGDKELLGKQVVKILSLFQKGTDPTITKMATEIVEESVSTCVDRTILALDDLLMLVLQKEAQESGNMEEIRAATKHSMIIGLSDSIAMQYSGLQIENVLKARLLIRTLFKLPALVQSMAYGSQASFNTFSKKNMREIKAGSTDEKVTKFIESGKSSWDEFQKTNIFLPNFEELPVEDLYAEEMPECCLTNMVYDEMVEYKGGYYGYEALLQAYRNKQSITNDLELIDPKHIHKVVLKKDANT